MDDVKYDAEGSGLVISTRVRVGVRKVLRDIQDYV